MPQHSSPFGRGQPSVSEAGEGVFNPDLEFIRPSSPFASVGYFSRREKNVWFTLCLRIGTAGVTRLPPRGRGRARRIGSRYVGEAGEPGHIPLPSGEDRRGVSEADTLARQVRGSSNPTRIHKALIAFAALGHFSRREKNAWLIPLRFARVLLPEGEECVVLGGMAGCPHVLDGISGGGLPPRRQAARMRASMRRGRPTTLPPTRPSRC